MKSLLLYLAAGLLCGTGNQSLASDIHINPQPAAAYDCDAMLVGEIKSGDAARLERALEPVRQRSNPTICLNSTGGAFNEGIALADLFRSLRFTTRLQPGARCFSSCAIAFMGGTWGSESGEGDFAHRLMAPSSQLGFHAPYLRLGGADFNRENVRSAYTQSTRSIGRLLDTALRIKLDLKLIQEMLFRGQDELYMIDSLAKLGLFGIGLHGYAELGHFPGAAFHTCWNYYAWREGLTLVDIYAGQRQEAAYDVIHDAIRADYNAFVNNPDEFRADGIDFSFMPGDFSVECKVKFYPAEIMSYDVLTQKLDYSEMPGFKQEGTPDILLPKGWMPAWAMLDGETALTDIAEGPVIDLAYNMGHRAP